VDVEVPNVVFLLYVFPAQLCELLKPIAVIEPEDRQPELLITDDLVSRLGAEMRMTPGPYWRCEQLPQQFTFPHTP